MMTPEQRYLFDVQGFLHLKGAIAPDEVQRARAAAERYCSTAPEELPPGFAITAVVLGGVNIAGGSGSIIGVLLGAILTTRAPVLTAG